MPRLKNRSIGRERVLAQTYLQGLYNSCLVAQECAKEYAHKLVMELDRRIYGSIRSVVKPYVQYLCYRRRLTLINIIGGDRIVLPPFYCISFRRLYELAREYLEVQAGISLRLSRDGMGTIIVPCYDADCTSYLNHSQWYVYYYLHN